MEKIKITIFFILISAFSFSQKKITVLESEFLEGVIDAQILSSEGALLFNTDINGEFTFIEIDKIKKIIIYHPSYNIVEYNVNEIPDKIILKKKPIQLTEVVIKGKKKRRKYFKVKGYVRSWQLENNKLIKYGDALVHYLIPYDKKGKNDIRTGIKNYITSYRTFKIDSIKDESRIISISTKHDNYLNIKIPIRNILKRQSYENYELKKVNDSLSSIVKNGNKKGYVIYKDKYPVKVGIDDYFSETKSILDFKLGSKNIEVWSDKDTKHLLYLYSNEKSSIKTKLVNKTKTIETVREVFIDKNISYDTKKPKKSRKYLKVDRSYYKSDYWSKEIEKHPLPINVKKQLLKIRENKNIF